MSDFGKIPKGVGFGMVPKFALRLPDVRPGPKALYASLFTNASPEGILWRSLTKLGEEFGISTRQVQRWVNDLERAGLLVRMGWEGKTNRFLVVRNEAGLNWAQRESLKNIVDRKVRRSEQTASNSVDAATHMSSTHDGDDVTTTTPASHKHDPSKQNKPTNQSPRQEKIESGSGASAQNKETWGLKCLSFGERAEEIQTALNTIADSPGWDVLATMSPTRISEELENFHGLRLSTKEIRSFLAPST